jgi:hypothetical protein
MSVFGNIDKGAKIPTGQAQAGNNAIDFGSLTL